MPMLERFLQLTAAAPNEPALVEGDSGATITRAALLDTARAFGRGFAENGLREGDLVAVQLPNSVEFVARSEEHTSELQSRPHLVCRLLLEKKKKTNYCSFPCKKKKTNIKQY